MAHTPGPWKSQGWVPTWAYIPVHDAAHNLVASLYPDSAHNYTRDQVEANARLIAAAPEMLEALQMVADRCADVAIIIEDCPKYDAPGFLRATEKRIRAAIAKATGNP